MSDAALRARIRAIISQQIAQPVNKPYAAGRRHRRVVHRRKRGHGYLSGMGLLYGEGLLYGGRKRRVHRVRKVRKHRGKGRAGHSDWISFVKQFARQHRMSYKDALVDAAPEYRALQGMGRRRVHRRRVVHRKRGMGYESHAKRARAAKLGWARRRRHARGHGMHSLAMRRLHGYM